MADVEAFSVDPLCDLGAKNFNLVLNSFLLIECLARTLRCLSVISAFFLADRFCGGARRRKVSHSGAGCQLFAGARGVWARFAVKRAPFTGMLPSGRLVRRSSGWALS
jgi:hypothetical protein